MVFKVLSNSNHSVLTPLQCTMTDSPWTEEYMCKIYEVHETVLKKTEMSQFLFFNTLYLCWRKMTGWIQVEKKFKCKNQL